MWSVSSDRSNPVPLDDATVSGNIYVFTGPDQGVASVSFYVDDLNREGNPYKSESAAPYDLAGTQSNRSATGYDADQLIGSGHTITVLITLMDGRTVLVTATFSVVTNQATPPPLLPEIYSLQWSPFSDRSDSVPLQDAKVSGNIHVFTNPDQGVAGVSFYVDDPDRESSPYRSEGFAPYDLGGTQNNTDAGGYNTAQLNEGEHSIAVEINLTNGSTTIVTATFNVENQLALPPFPPEAYSLLWSVSSDRSNPAPLEDADVSGNIYVFTDPNQGVAGVSFYVDDPNQQSSPYRFRTLRPV